MLSALLPAPIGCVIRNDTAAAMPLTVEAVPEELTRQGFPIDEAGWKLMHDDAGSSAVRGHHQLAGFWIRPYQSVSATGVENLPKEQSRRDLSACLFPGADYPGRLGAGVITASVLRRGCRRFLSQGMTSAQVARAVGQA